MNNSSQDSDFLKELTVLYVEDENDTRDQLAEILRRRVGTLITANSGPAGLEAFRAKKPRMVITDILMPLTDGLVMAQEIRFLDRTVPIIVTTAFERTDYLLRSIDVGIDKYVMKPVSMDRLNEALLECAHRLRAEDLLSRQREQESEMRRLEAISILADGIASDYNNLLQVIMRHIELAKKAAEPDSKVFRHIQNAELPSEQARELSKRLMLLAGGGYECFQVAHLAPVISSAVDAAIHGNTTTHGFVSAVTASLKGNKIRREFDLPTDLPTVAFDESQMRLVFTHLTLNAVEAMRSEGIIRVSAQAATITEKDELPLKPGSYLNITFRDTGVGIAPDNLPKIFDPYFSAREKNTSKRLGLGLALCRAIIRKHGGMITVESKKGEGATFRILLPVKS
ncbi:MAG: response regulator [Candidatus Riflebacteria bacterium]|nr:response regulator [Candidatus Riflebacteria bacterium]